MITGGETGGRVRFQVYTDDQWVRVEPLLPSPDGQRGRPFRNRHQGGREHHVRVPVRDCLAGPAGAVRLVADPVEAPPPFRRRRNPGRIDAVLLAQPDAAGDSGWTVSVDATINRAHQHGTNLPRSAGGSAGLQEPPDRA